MKLDEALAVYLYLQHARRGPEEERDFKAAWDVICDHALLATVKRMQRS